MEKEKKEKKRNENVGYKLSVTFGTERKTVALQGYNNSPTVYDYILGGWASINDFVCQLVSHTLEIS